MIPPFFGLTNWGVMSNSAPHDNLKGKCLCGCHTKGVRPDATVKASWCRDCNAERNQPWTDWIASII